MIYQIFKYLYHRKYKNILFLILSNLSIYLKKNYIVLCIYIHNMYIYNISNQCRSNENSIYLNDVCKEIDQNMPHLRHHEFWLK